MVMALPQRTPSWYEDDRRPDDGAGAGEPLVSIGYPELFGVDDLDEDEPWCVDHDDGMDVMTTRALRAALAAGTLSWSTKVWRDGNGFWHEIGELPELVGEAAFDWQPAEPSYDPTDEIDEEPVEHSTIRRVKQPSLGPAAERAAGGRAAAEAIAALPSLEVVLVALAMLLLPTAGYLAARLVDGQPAQTPHVRTTVDDLGQRLAGHSLSLPVLPFPSPAIAPRPAVTYVVPHPSRPHWPHRR